jgi:hypothetical protein
MEFNLKTRDAMALDSPPVLPDTEPIIQVEATLGVGCTTPQKSQSALFSVRACAMFMFSYAPDTM